MEVNPLLTNLKRQQVESPGRPIEKSTRSHSSRNRKAPELFAPVTPVAPSRRWYLPCKAAVEFTLALILFVLAMPFILLAAALVKLTSRGPAFYAQTRVGRNGRLFTIYKIRTMVHDCESLTGPRWSMPGDPRITRVGHFLRLTHTDELPQLINVLRGDMSIIGPRPERPEFLPKLERVVPMYRNRLAIRPGITGLAQVNLGADTDVENVRKKLAYDLHYIRHISPWLDWRIVMATFFYILRNPCKITQKMSIVPHGETVEKPMKATNGEELPGRERKCA
jgi:lipopolysaccharide/colanic/teichoic acid biosynthesis glycosyltransferase